MNYLYQITNLINGKIYIGVHVTIDINDGYMGSGTAIKRAIKKYGIENFRKDILGRYDTEEIMYQKEAEIVTEDFLKRNDVYNMKLGGPANFYYVNKAGLNHKVDQHLIHGNKIKTDHEYRLNFSKTMSMANARPATKALQRKWALANCKNKGRFWVSNDVLEKSIMVNNEDFPNMHGWYRGLKYRKQRHDHVAE